jgi:hypothetical protein
MSQLDLTPYYGLAQAPLSTEHLEIARKAFAIDITDYAFTCKDERELVDGLTVAMPPDSGLLYPRVVGEGSCRRVYVTSFGLVLKVTGTTS